MQGGEGGEGPKSGNEIGHVHVPPPHDECRHYYYKHVPEKKKIM